MTDNCCPPPEDSDEIYYWCHVAGPGHEQRKAKKGYSHLPNSLANTVTQPTKQP